MRMTTINVIKSAAGVLLGSAIMITGLSTSAQAQVGPAYQGNAYYVCTSTPNGTLTMRSGPSKGSKAKLSLPNGTSIRVIDTVTAGDGFDWHKISYGRSIGWVRYDYVCN